MTEYAFEGAKRASTTISWSFGTQTYLADARYAYSDPIDPIYQSTVRAAFARWSSVSSLNFLEVGDAPSNAIRIGFGRFSSAAVVGETAFSYGAGLLRPDTILRLLDPAITPLTLNARGGWVYDTTAITLYQVVLHEIGHALGLGHTTDPLTNMYPVATAANTDLALGDIQGINSLYPLYTVTALDPVQIEGNRGVTAYHFAITRYSDPAQALSITYSVKGTPYPALAGTSAASADEFVGGSLPSGQVSFAAGARTTTLTVAVAANTVAQPDLGFAITLGSTSATDQVTTRGTVSALILDDDNFASVNGVTVGVYRFFSQADGAHFYTASELERNTLVLSRPDLVYEGAGLNAIANPTTDASASAVYRFFDTQYGTHFYTASTVERDATQLGRPDLVYEGIGFYEHASPRPGDAPVFRFFNAELGTHFYTASVSERATTMATRSDLIDEGVGFYEPA